MQQHRADAVECSTQATVEQHRCNGCAGPCPTILRVQDKGTDAIIVLGVAKKQARCGDLAPQLPMTVMQRTAGSVRTA